MKTVIGIDVGTRRIGLAKGDTEVKLASPLPPVFNDGEALDRIARTIKSLGVDVVVVGLPRNADGLETKQSDYSRQFADDLSDTLANTACYPEITFQDESLSSVKAEDMLRQDKRHFNERMLRDGTLDSEAAVVILTDYLEALS